MPRGVKKGNLADVVTDGAIEEDLSEEAVGTIMQRIPGPNPEFKSKIERVVKDYVSRQAHLGGILEYTSHTAVVDPEHTLVWDWNQATVTENNSAALMPLILRPSEQGTTGTLKEIIILKSRFSFAPMNNKYIASSSVLPGNSTTWQQLASKAKGPTSIEPDVIVLKRINGVWYLYIVELKIGAGQADKSNPKEHIQLMRGKRLIQYYIDEYGSDIKPENIKLYFCAWMHGTAKKVVDFKRWEPAEGNAQWDAHVLQGPDKYAEVIGVKGRFIDAMLKKLESYRQEALASIFKKFTSKTGRYYDEWQQLQKKIVNNLRAHPKNFEAAGEPPAFAPHPLISAKGYSGKVKTFAAGVKNAVQLLGKSKSPSQFTGARLTAKVRDARRKAHVYYKNFKLRYKERLRRSGQTTNQPESVFISAFLTATPRTGTTPRAKSINLASRQNIERNVNRIAREALSLHSQSKFKNFANAKARFSALAARIKNSNHPANFKNTVATIRATINRLPGPASRPPVERKRKATNTPTETSLIFIKGFQNMPNTQAKKVLKTLGGAQTVMASLNGKGQAITNSQLRNAINASVPKQTRTSVRAGGTARRVYSNSPGSPMNIPMAAASARAPSSTPRRKATPAAKTARGRAASARPSPNRTPSGTVRG
jgi:hypothetical protein